MGRTTLDRWEDRYAHRVLGMRSSAMRDLMALTQRPEVISFGGGLPDMGVFDLPEIAASTAELLREAGALALQYGPTEGIPAATDAIVELMRYEGMDPDPAHVVVTTGGQQVLDLVARTFLDVGDVVIAEGPTYPGAIPCFSAVQADVRHVPLDEHGLDPALVEAELESAARSGRPAKYLYTIPTFQNPGGCTTTIERRHALVELAHEWNLVVLEDNPYSLLRYDGEPVPTLRSLDTHGNVIYLGTFSKVLAPGVRVGWLEAPPPILRRVNVMKQAADLCTSTFMQLFVARFFAEHPIEAWVHSLRDHYRSRRDALVEGVREQLPAGTRITSPEGGLFAWATLPEPLDTTDLLARALDRDVAFVPGSAAFADARATTSMRLNFSQLDEARIAEGLERLGSCARDALELAQALGVATTEEGPA